MLLSVQELGGDNLVDMVGNVVAEDKGQSLARVNLDAGNKALPEHAVSPLLYKCNFGMLLAIEAFGDDIKLKFDILAVERRYFALLGSRLLRLSVDGSDVTLFSVAKCREYFDVYQTKLANNG